jgi:RecG-like helicase
MSEAFNANTLSRLKKIGIEEPVDLIRHLPGSYDDFTKPLKSLPAILALPHGHGFYAMLKLEAVRSHEELRQEKIARGESVKHGEVPYIRVELSDGMRKTSALVFGRVDPWLTLKKTSLNKIVHVSGKVVHKTTDRGQFVNLSAIEPVPASQQNKIVGRYRGKEKVITPEKVGDLTKIALLHYADQAVEQLLDELGVSEELAMSQCRIPFFNLKQMLMTLHNPHSVDDLEKALMSARRLSAYYGIRQAMDATTRQPNPQARIPMNKDLIKELVERHPFTPTRDQRQAIWDVICDLDGETPMDRLISADVGNGKTMAYGIPAAYVSKSGRNSVIMLPTEPLAGQVAQNIQSWYPDIKVRLATAGFNEQANQGDILVGTTALLSWLQKNPDWKVDFAIVDEQQKMGTLQRDALNSLGTHVLEATATPIPRTMAQTIFGHKKVTVIKDCPVQKDITSHLLGNSNEEKLVAYNTLSKWLERGKKVIVIYPLVAEQQGYYFHINAEDSKKAEKVAALIRKASLSLKGVKPVEDEECQALLAEMDNSVEDGFIAEFHGEEEDFKRLQKRFSRYLGDAEPQVQYLGSRVDSDLNERNRKTILRNKESWEKRRPGKVAMIHGRSKRAEKIAIINEMNSGKYDLLISTTLIEIGVDVKDSCALLVLNAEQLGAYTLHQLRGRLARNGGTADFMMMSSGPLEELEEGARARLDLLLKFKSGDDIALYDMEQRGFGNLAAGGKSQKGFEDGLFPSIKLTPSELDAFLKDMAKDIQANQKDEREPVASP